MLTVNELASMIDHAIIDANATEADMHAGIDLALKYQTATFVTQPFRVKAARKRLDGSKVGLQTTVGFPFGHDHTAAKVFQARLALDEGVDELDLVTNISAMRSGEFAAFQDDVHAVVELAEPYGVTVKGIIECFYLTRPERLHAARLVEGAGAAFVKTSTGQRPDFQASIAEDCRQMRAILKPETVVKASGGCFNLDALLLYYEAGARRFGASETANILEDLRERMAAGSPMELVHTAG